MAVSRRALSLATAGFLAGSAVALATDGFIQLPEGAAVAAQDSQHQHVVDQVLLQRETDQPIHDSAHRFTSGKCKLTIQQPEVVEPVRRAAGGAAGYVEYRDWWKGYEYDADIQLVLVSYSDWTFQQGQPVDLEVKSQRLRYDWFESMGELRLNGGADTSYWNQGEDDDILAVLLGLHYFYEDD